LNSSDEFRRLYAAARQLETDRFDVIRGHPESVDALPLAQAAPDIDTIDDYARRVQVNPWGQVGNAAGRPAPQTALDRQGRHGCCRCRRQSKSLNA
jgi:hypothetical protein